MKPTGFYNLSAEDAEIILELAPILDIAFIKPIGASEKKFYIETKHGIKRLLRIAPIKDYRWIKDDDSAYEYMATVGVNVTNAGGGTISERGVVISKSQNPTIESNGGKYNSGTGLSVSYNLTGLTASTTYYVRAYAINQAGTAYGSQHSFTTSSGGGGGGGVCTWTNVTTSSLVSAIMGSHCYTTNDDYRFTIKNNTNQTVKFAICVKMTDGSWFSDHTLSGVAPGASTSFNVCRSAVAGGRKPTKEIKVFSIPLETYNTNGCGLPSCN